MLEVLNELEAAEINVGRLNVGRQAVSHDMFSHPQLQLSMLYSFTGYGYCRYDSPHGQIDHMLFCAAYKQLRTLCGRDGNSMFSPRYRRC